MSFVRSKVRCYITLNLIIRNSIHRNKTLFFNVAFFKLPFYYSIYGDVWFSIILLQYVLCSLILLLAVTSHVSTNICESLDLTNRNDASTYFLSHNFLLTFANAHVHKNGLTLKPWEGFVSKDGMERRGSERGFGTRVLFLVCCVCSKKGRE